MSEQIDSKDIRFMQDSDGRIGVGYCPDKDKGGFQVIRWLPEYMLTTAAKALADRSIDAAYHKSIADTAEGGE